MDELRILTCSQTGGGHVSKIAVENGFKWDPHVIVGQGTSSDPGPGYLGSDEMYLHAGKLNQRREMELIYVKAKQNNVPFVFSVGSPCGDDLRLEGTLRIIDDIARENNLRFRIAVISGELDKEYVKQKILSGAKMKRLVDTPRLDEYLTVKEVEQSKRIVTQMGPEPMMKALDLDVDGVITGRALDTGVCMAMALKKGFDKGLSAHMAKTIECSAQCAVPSQSENIFAILRKDHFLVRPPNPARKCTVMSVAAHAFYERPDITKELNPGGYLDISEAKYEQYDESTVKVSGGKWVPVKYGIKIEGVKSIGNRTIVIAGIRDPVMISQLSPFLEGVKRKVVEKFSYVPAEDYQLSFHIYGKDAVLGSSEPEPDKVGKELCLIIESIAKTQDLSAAVAGYTQGQILFGDFPGRTTTAGNVAYKFSPREMPTGEVYIWNVWHLMELDDPCEPFKINVIEFPRKVVA